MCGLKEEADHLPRRYVTVHPHCGNRRFRVERWPFLPPRLAFALIDWGVKHRRDFPWRRRREPFQHLVAEMLLRKTTARQVKAVFISLIDRYDTPQKLADADPKQLAHILRPLGLAHQRSEALIAMARYLVSHFDGQVPVDPEDLSRVPHVGPYAAAAVGNFVFGLPLPIVDTNVIRIFDRFTGQETGTKNPHRQPSIWRRSVRSLPTEKVADYNYALLDLGAEVCGKRPVCAKCPLVCGCASSAKPVP